MFKDIQRRCLQKQSMSDLEALKFRCDKCVIEYLLRKTTIMSFLVKINKNYCAYKKTVVMYTKLLKVIL